MDNLLIKKQIYLSILKLKPNQGGIGTADANATVQNAAAGIVGVIKALIVLFVFVNIIYSTGFDPIGGIVDLVNTFLDGGFAVYLLASLSLVSRINNQIGQMRGFVLKTSPHALFRGIYAQRWI